jgi:heat shock protein HslJ
MLKKILIGLSVAMLMLGCNSATPKTQKEAKVEEKLPIIEAIPYKLVSFGKLRMAVPKKAKILLKDGEFAGHAGCNGMGGTYKIDGYNIKFTLGPSTMMACPDMRMETRIRKDLSEVDNYTVRGKFLILKIGDREVLNFIEM